MSTLDWAALVKDAGDVTEGFSPLPNGDYLLEVVKAETKPTSTGKTMFKLQLKVVGGQYNNRRVFDNLVISPENENALKMVLSKFYAMGFTPEFFNQSPQPTNERIEEVLMGRTFVGSLSQSEYKGKLGNEISRYSKVPTDAPAASSAPAAAPAPSAALAAPEAAASALPPAAPAPF